jgi:hypothetical protein
MLEIGPEGEEVDRLVYITKWEKVIKQIMLENPALKKSFARVVLMKRLLSI